MNWTTLWTQLNFNTILIVAGALGYVFVKWREGGKKAEQENSKAKDDLISTLTGQLKAQKEINESVTMQYEGCQHQINNMKQELGKMQGVNETIDAILKRGAPELDKTLRALTLYTFEGKLFMADVRKALNLKERRITPQLNAIETAVGEPPPLEEPEE